MDKEIEETREKWCKALESGDFIQGTGTMCQEVEGQTLHCCLSVLMCVTQDKHDYRMAASGPLKDQRAWKSPRVSMDYSCIAPREVLKLVGMSEGMARELANMNDRGKTFAQIAELIRSDTV